MRKISAFAKSNPHFSCQLDSSLIYLCNVLLIAYYANNEKPSGESRIRAGYRTEINKVQSTESGKYP